MLAPSQASVHRRAIMRRAGLPPGSRRNDWRAILEPEAPMRIDAPLVRDVMAATAYHFQMEINDLLSRKRPVILAKVRHIAMYLSREMTGRTFAEIGYVMNDRDHTTIMHGYYKTLNLMRANPSIARAVADIKQRMEMQHAARKV